MDQSLLSRLMLAALFTGGGTLAFFESIYLRDQAAEFASIGIARWMWAFRIVTGLFILFVVLILLSLA